MDWKGLTRIQKDFKLEQSRDKKESAHQKNAALLCTAGSQYQPSGPDLAERVCPAHQIHSYPEITLV